MRKKDENPAGQGGASEGSKNCRSASEFNSPSEINQAGNVVRFPRPKAKRPRGGVVVMGWTPALRGDWVYLLHLVDGCLIPLGIATNPDMARKVGPKLAKRFGATFYDVIGDFNVGEGGAA